MSPCLKIIPRPETWWHTKSIRFEHSPPLLLLLLKREAWRACSETDMREVCFLRYRLDPHSSFWYVVMSVAYTIFVHLVRLCLCVCGVQVVAGGWT